MGSAPANETGPRPPVAEGDGEEAVREAAGGGGQRQPVGHRGARAGADLELAAGGGADLGGKDDARDHLVRAGLHLLERDGRAGFVTDPAVAPVVEVEIGFGLDEGAAGGGVGVEHDDLVRVDAGQGAVGPAAGGVVEHFLAGYACAALHGADAVPGGGDRGAGEDVVEGGEEEVVPGPVEAGESGVAPRVVGGQGAGGGFGLDEELLAVALGGLDVVHHAVAAGEGVLQLGGDAGQVGGPVGDCLEERLGGGEDQLVAREVVVGEDPLDHRLRRAAAVVADAVEAHGVAEGGVDAVDGDLHLAGEIGEVGDVAGLDAEGGDLGAAGALPAEDVGGEGDLVLFGPAEDVGLVAMFEEDVGQARGVAEAVDVVADPGRDAEAVAEVALAVDDLAVQVLGGRQVEVGLDELAAGDVPLAAFDQAADAGEQLGVEAFDLPVEPGLAAGEDELRVFVAAVGHRGGGGQRLVGAGLPRPEPHRVDVGVGDHVDAHGRLSP